MVAKLPPRSQTDILYEQFRMTGVVPKDIGNCDVRIFTGELVKNENGHWIKNPDYVPTEAITHGCVARQQLARSSLPREDFDVDWEAFENVGFPKLRRMADGYERWRERDGFSPCIYNGERIHYTGILNISKSLGEIANMRFRVTILEDLELGRHVVVGIDGLPVAYATHTLGYTALPRVTDDIVYSQPNPLCFPVLAELMNYTMRPAGDGGFLALSIMLPAGRYRLVKYPKDNGLTVLFDIIQASDKFGCKLWVQPKPAENNRGDGDATTR
jgi:hypothetical protein